MPLPIAHGCVGAAIVALIHPKINKLISFPLLFGGFLANAADLDFFLSYSTGDKSWHRGFTHSILFSAVIFGCLFIFFKRERLREAIAYGLAYFSHLVLDFATSDHGGPELFWFFSDRRLSVGWRTFSVAPSKLPAGEIALAVFWETAVFGSIFFAVYFLMRQFYPARFSAAG
ncbi:MAG: metal-dependent hydrolase [Acidobacteria bacterium]|nr:metal-dependent hydrolase [Acidobacteriota bacterium]